MSYYLARVRNMSKKQRTIRLVLGQRILNKAGLKEGDYVQIKVRDGHIEIRKIELE